jgi:molecular chaperone IbpA
MSDLTINIENQILSIVGQKFDKNEARKFLHQGIAGRDFDRRFQLAEHVKVKDAAFADGLLYIDLVREIPDSMRPKSVPIRERNNVLSDVSRRNVA